MIVIQVYQTLQDTSLAVPTAVLWMTQDYSVYFIKEKTKLWGRYVKMTMHNALFISIKYPCDPLINKGYNLHI